MENIVIGDHVICIMDGVSGVVVKKYYPTACGEQTMIRTEDGRLYHAPTVWFRLCVTRGPREGVSS